MMNKQKIIIFLSILTSFLLISCSTSSVNPESQKDEVVSRINDSNSRPSWLDESKPFQMRDGQVLSLGQATVPSNSRLEAAYRVAENNAKASIASAVESKLEFIFQNAEEGVAMDATQARYIGAEISKIVTSSMKTESRYWEKVSSLQEFGGRSIQYRIFTVVTMPEIDFKKAVLDAIRKREGKLGISADFSKKVDAHWDQFVGGDDQNKSVSEPNKVIKSN